MQDEPRMTAELIRNLNLTRSQILMLWALIESPHVTHDELYEAVYGKRIIGSNALLVHISKLRRALADHGIELNNVLGLGYSLPPGSKARLRLLSMREAA